MNNGETETHLSVYGDGAQAEDFPVLKAFQQYIDAEQEKARKRMIALSAIFGVVLLVFIAAFILVVGYVNQQANKLAERNQALNDRLIEYAMKQQTQPAAPAGDNGASALKAVTESLAQLQTQMIQQQQAAMATAQKAAQSAPKPAAETVKESDVEKLRRATELLRDEKAKITLEKERLHREEVERQRRRLYPEYYARQDALNKKAASDDVAELLDDVEDMKDDEDYEPIVAPKPRKTVVAKPKPFAAKKPAAGKQPVAKKIPAKITNPEEDAIDYFKDDSFVIPSDSSSGSTSKFRVPLN